MKTTQLQFRFDAAKLKALEFYLPNNGTSVEEELQKKFNELYDNEVPQNVKDFLKFQSGDVTQSQDSGAEQSDAPVENKSSRRQKSSSPKAEAAAESEPMESGQTLTM